jgi:hypothetical protein
MEVLIGIVGILGVLWLWFRLSRASAINRLADAGAIRRPLSVESAGLDYLGLASFGNHMFENTVRARLADDGSVVSFKKEDDEVLLPLELVAVTGNKWTHPLKFGTGTKAVGINLGNAVPCEAVAKRKAESTSMGKLI